MSIINLKINISEELGSVSAILNQPKNSKYLLVLAHGAGADMTHAFMETLSNDLAKKEIATLRFNFRYKELGKGAPDRPKVALPTVKAAIEKGIELANGLPVLAGGKSFGGRMTSQLAATETLENVKGLVFFGFPLHSPAKVGIERAAHLQDIVHPMLFLQGTRDTLAKIPLITQVCDGLDKATLSIMDGGDHSFKTLKRSGITHEEMIEKLANTTRMWADEL
ncbi:MAG: alpha/beta hydrolase [Bacteroidetes bacterium]|jgi:predicted alpha/beta-hydrolase family hydrolase|nr:alpha/beta hydrolase [Bacteroidota bacterium]MDF1863501.1 hypothetical protein [Saprospiraceae bacterium]